MKGRLEAAYHEAGHALLAYLSDYHLMGPIDLKSAGHGGLYVGLSKAKCLQAGKKADPAIAREPEVARDFAVILVAGFVAEQIAAEKNPAVTPDAAFAVPDHENLARVLAAANLSRKTDRYEELARRKLTDHWDQVQSLANVLLRDGACPSETADEIFSNNA